MHALISNCRGQWNRANHPRPKHQNPQRPGWAFSPPHHSPSPIHHEYQPPPVHAWNTNCVELMPDLISYTLFYPSDITKSTVVTKITRPTTKKPLKTAPLAAQTPANPQKSAIFSIFRVRIGHKSPFFGHFTIPKKTRNQQIDQIDL